jgi:predicted short-subunit dehydrogenase-like oxidoreductase (DUF2520 family)
MLAAACNATWSPVPEFRSGNDIIIVSVPDRILPEVLASINCNEKTLVVHTAGSYNLELFPEKMQRKGVFYPLQTFSKNRNVSLQGIPIFIECSDSDDEALLGNFAENLGAKAYFIDAERRKLLHLAAVFICNFTNHMLTAGDVIATKADMPFDIFIPLLQETVAKAVTNGPLDSQTGPAIRNDINTIEKHLDLLSFSPELQKIYRELTVSISDFYKKKG